MSERLEFPFDIEGYIDSWTRWHVIREIVTNAMDAGENWAMTREKGSFSDIVTITDDGEGMALENLLVGNTGHSRDIRHIGQFGEGLKMALLVLTRFGVRAEIVSGKYRIWNEQSTKFGRPIMHVVYEEVEQRPGTTVTFPWPNDEPIYEDRFLLPDDPRIIWTDEDTGRQILRVDKPDLYHKGVWVQPAKYYSTAYAFGYNLVTSKLERDRNSVDPWEAGVEIGKMWGSVKDPEVLAMYWDAVSARTGEYFLRVRALNNVAELQESFARMYGKYAVMRTSSDGERAARHALAEVIDVGSSIAESLGAVLQTDIDYVQEMNGQSRVPIKDKELPEEKLKTLRRARRLAKKIGFQGKITACIFDGPGAEALNGNIRMSPDVLESYHRTVKTLIHELAHTEHGAEDRTPRMEEAILTVAADMIAGG